ncbi:GTP-binding protein [Escherichia coli]|uniref:GTP-binding protein n=1 Tax=Escherichia coli TaxID=562 RepID=A0A377CFR7_ECOLX|nr:GTP-binding protein [Escherichia coli]
MAAFKATLQETRQATLLLHVIDAADVRVQENIEAVNTVLEEIDAHEIPTLLVMNKIDMLEDFEPRIDRDEENKPIRVWLSAQTGAGIPQLFQALTERLSGEVAQQYIASATAGRASEKSFLSASGNRKRVDGGGRQRKSASSYADR